MAKALSKPESNLKKLTKSPIPMNFVKKHKAQMEQRPVFSTFWVDKSDEEKADMKAKLADGIGYDK